MDNPQVAAYIVDLQAKNYTLRWNACILLGQIGYASAVHGLVEVMADKNEYVRRRAAFALCQIGDASAVSALIEGLQDENREVRNAVAEALMKMGETSAVPALAEASKQWGGSVIPSLCHARFSPSHGGPRRKEWICWRDCDAYSTTRTPGVDAKSPCTIRFQRL